MNPKQNTVDCLPKKHLFQERKSVVDIYCADFIYSAPRPLLLIRTDVVRQEDPFYDEKNVHADSDARLHVLCKLGFWVCAPDSLVYAETQ